MNKNKLYWQIAVCMVISTVAVCGGNIKMKLLENILTRQRHRLCTR